jgi:LemA protein
MFPGARGGARRKEIGAMNKGLIVTLAVVAVLLLGLGGCVVGQYNGLVTARESVSNRWAQVDNQLQRRNDLIGNLVETVKGVAAQEQEVFGAIADARARMAGARTPAEGIEAGRAMDTALGRLLLVVENYPQLRSSEAFLQLMDEVAGTENRLSTERGRYNDEVRGYNTRIKRFPTNLVAGAFNFGESPYYEIPDAARELPRVDFSGIRQGGSEGQSGR